MIVLKTITVLPARKSQLRFRSSRLSHLPLDRCALKFMKSFSSQAIGLLKRMVDALSLDVYYSFASISVLQCDLKNDMSKHDLNKLICSGISLYLCLLIEGERANNVNKGGFLGKWLYLFQYGDSLTLNIASCLYLREELQCCFEMFQTEAAVLQ